jgi:hypothetical protein
LQNGSPTIDLGKSPSLKIAKITACKLIGCSSMHPWNVTLHRDNSPPYAGLGYRPPQDWKAEIRRAVCYCKTPFQLYVCSVKNLSYPALRQNLFRLKLKKEIALIRRRNVFRTIGLESLWLSGAERLYTSCI